MPRLKERGITPFSLEKNNHVPACFLFISEIPKSISPSWVKSIFFTVWHCSGNLSGLIASSTLNEWVISGRQVVMYWAPVVRLLCVCHTKHCHGKHADWNRPPWPGTIVTICMSCFVTGDPEKEYGTSKPPPTGRVRERLKEDTACPSTSQNPSRWHPSWLSDTCATRKNSELEWLAKDHPETNPITIKPETASHAAEQFSWVPLPTALHPGALSQ